MERGYITNQQKREVLDRDGWCCSNCGYVPFHTSKEIPWWAKQNVYGFYGFMHDRTSKPPIIILEEGFSRVEDSKEGICNCRFVYLHGGELEFDHIIPVFKGGSSELDNYQALCHKCHSLKSGLDYTFTVATKYALSKYQPVRIGTPPL